MTALQSDYAQQLVDRFAKANPYKPPVPLPPDAPTMSAAPGESMGKSIALAPGRLIGSLATETIVRPAQHLDYAVSRLAGALGATQFAKDVQRDAQRIGRENAATTLGQLGNDRGAATFVGNAAGTVLKWSIPMIGATDTALAAHERTFNETGSDVAAIGSAAIETIAGFAGFSIAKNASPALARSVGAMVKRGEWKAASTAVGSLSTGAGANVGIGYTGFVLDQMQQVATSNKTADEAFEIIKAHSIDVISEAAIGGALMTGGGALHHAFKTRIEAANNVGEVVQVVKEAHTVAAMPEAKRAEIASVIAARTDAPPVEVKPPQAAMGAASAEELSGPTSVKNAVTAAERERHNLPPAVEPIPESIAQWDADAKDRLQRDPNAGNALVQEVLDNNGRTLNDRETAILLNHQTKVQNDLQQVRFDLFKAEEAGDTALVAELKIQESKLSDDLLDIYDAAKSAGTQWGRGGVARQMMMREDFSLAGMETAKRAAVGGRKLTEPEKAEIKDLFDAIQQSDAALSEHIASTEAAVAEKSAAREHTRLTTAVKKEAGAPAKSQAEILSGIGEKPSDAELSSIARELAKHFIRQGVTDRGEVVTKVHEVLQSRIEGITPRQVQDAISLYGQFKALNKDPIAVKLREIAGELQQVSKLQDMEAGQAPRKTGMERREPTDAERELIKQVNEKKKEAGFTVTDPARQLKSALDAVKTRLRNAVKDLQKQIATREQIVKSRKALQYDAEANAIKKQRDDLKSQYDEIFGKRQITDEQRLGAAITAVEQQIQQLEKRIAAKDFSQAEGRAPLKDAGLDALKARRDALAEQFKELKSLDPASMQDAAARSLQQYKRSLADRNAKLLERLAARDTGPERGQKSRVLDDEGKVLADENARLKSQFGEMLLNDRMARRLTGEIAEMKGQIAAGQVPDRAPKKQPRTLPADVRRLKFERDRLKAIQERQRRNMEAGVVKRILKGTGVVRMVMTVGEFSFILRQGGGQFFRAIGAIPAGDFKAEGLRSFAASAAKSFKAFGSQKFAAAHDNALFNAENAHLWDRDKLPIIHPEEGLSGAEEVYVGNWADKLPVVKNFNRAARVFLNDIRTNAYDMMASSLTATGKPNEVEGKAIANYVKAATGHGGLGSFESSAPVLSQMLFSPRYFASRFQYLIGHPLWHAGGARKLIAKEYARTFLGMATFYALAAAAGAQIETDPRSSDFGKIRIGNTRIDPMLGLQQVVVLASRIATGKTKSVSGKVTPIRGNVPYGGADSADVAFNFLRSKLAPIPSMALNIASGRDQTGSEASALSELSKVGPLTYKDIYQAMREQGVPKGAAMGITAFFGIGLQTYKSKQAASSGPATASY